MGPSETTPVSRLAHPAEVGTLRRGAAATASGLRPMLAAMAGEGPPLKETAEFHVSVSKTTRHKHSCLYRCEPCQIEGTGPQMRDDPHWGDLEPLAHKKYLVVCYSYCDEDDKVCGMSDHVCYAMRERRCPHCDGQEIKFRKVGV